MHSFRRTTPPAYGLDYLAPLHNCNHNSKGLSNALAVEPPLSTKVIVAGSVAIDTCCDYKPSKTSSSPTTPQAATSNPASITHSLGGVGANITKTLHLLGTSVCLCSAVGDDALGSAALSMLVQCGISSDGIVTIPESHTAQYISINDTRKDLVLGMADMRIMEQTPHHFGSSSKRRTMLSKASWLVLDANWDASTLGGWLAEANSVGLKVAFEPVSMAKSRRLFDPQVSPGTVIGRFPVSLSTPNSLELAEMHDAASKAGLFESHGWWHYINVLGLSNFGERARLIHMTTKELVDKGIPQQSIQLLPFISTLVVKLGSQGVLLTQLLSSEDVRLRDPLAAPYILSRSRDDEAVFGGVYMRLFSPAEAVKLIDIRSVNGVGDTFMGVIVAGLAREKPKSIDELIDVAQQGAVMTLKHDHSVSPEVIALKALL